MKRNANVVSALLENFSIAEEALGTAADSAGSALAENEKYLDSIQGKINILKAEFESFSATLVESSLIKGVVDAATALLGLFEKVARFVDMIGGLPVILTAVGTIIASTSPKITKLLEKLTYSPGSVGNIFIDIIKILPAGLAKLSSILPNTIKLFTTFGSTFKSFATGAAMASGSVATLGTVINSFIPVVGILITAIQVLIPIIGNFITTSKEAIEKANEIAQKYDDANDTYKSNKKTLEDLREEFEKLSKGVDKNGKNVDLTAEEYDRYLEIIETIVDISPDICSGYNEEGRHILNYKGALDQAIESQEKWLSNQNAIYIASGEDTYKGAKASADDARKDLVKAGASIVDSVFGDMLMPLKDTKKYESMSDAFWSAIGQAGIEWSVGSWEDPDFLISIYDNYSEIIQLLRSSTYKDDLNGNKVILPTYSESEIQDISNAILGLANGYTKLTAAEDQMLEYYQQWSKYQGDAWYNAIPKDALDEFNAGLKDAVDLTSKNFNEQTGKIAAYGSSFAEASAEVSKLNDSLKEYGDQYNALVNGNVDYNERPLVTPERFLEYYPNADIDDVVTTYSSTTTIGEGEYLYTINVTPVLKDGTILTEDELDDYVAKLVTTDGVEGLLKSDKNDLVINVVPGDYDEEYWEDHENKLSEIKNKHAEIIGQMQLIADQGGAIGEYAESLLNYAIPGGTASNSSQSVINELTSGFVKEMKMLEEAALEVKETGQLSSATYEEHFANNEKLAELVDFTNDKFKLTKESIDEYVLALTEETAKSMAAAGATDEQIAQLSKYGTIVRTVLRDEYKSLDGLSELQSMLEDTKKPQDEQKEYSSDEYAKLIADYPKLAEYAVDVGKGYKFEAEGLKEVIRLEKERIRMTSLESVPGYQEARDKLIKNGDIATVNKMEEIFRLYGDGISSMEDFYEAYKKYWNTDVIPEKWRDGTLEFVEILITAQTALKAILDEVDKFGTDDYNPGNTVKDNNVDKDTETEFEKQYKLHQHYVSMEQETDEDYLRWLEGAVAHAKSIGELSAEDAYQYEEEIYEKRKDLFSDYLSDTEHQIEMMQNKEAPVEDIAPIYTQLMADVEAQKNKYFARGLDENSDYIQELESQWWDYRNSLLDLYKDDLSGKMSDYEHEITLIESNDKNGVRTGEIVDIYRQMQEETHVLAERYRALDLDENSDYIQELQNQWWDYQEKIDDIRQSEFDKYLEIGQYKIDAMTQDGASMDEIVDSWREILQSINNEIAYYSSIGYDMTSEVIRDLEDKAQDARDSMIEAIEAVVQKANDLVDGFENVYSTLTNAAKEYAQNGFLSVDSLQSILDLGPKYLAMLEDENGQLVINEESLQAVITARTNEMAAETAYAYAKQILLATEQNDIQTLENLIVVSQSAGNATWDMAYATLALAKAMGEAKGIDASYYETAYENLLKMQAVTKTSVDSISAYYKTLDESYISQKDALDKILQLTQDMLKQELEDQKKALEDQKDDYADIINQKKEMLQLAEEQEDREKSVAEKLEKMAKLQAQIAQLSLDDSREAQAQRRKLEEELAELQKELADDQSDYSLDVQTEALDKELEAFEESKDDEIEALDDMLSSAEKLYQAAIDRIENGWDTLYDDLCNWNYEYGSTLQSDLENAWNAALAAAERYGSFVNALDGVNGYTDLGESNYGEAPDLDELSSSVASDAARNTIDSMKEVSMAWWTQPDSARPDLEAKQRGLEAQYEQLTGEDIYRDNGRWYHENGSELYSMTDDEIIRAVVKKMEENAALWHTASASKQAELSKENVVLAQRLIDNLGLDITRDSAGVWWLGDRKLFDVYKYHTGGYVGSAPSLKENEVMAVLEKGEAVLDEQKERGLYKIVDFVSALSERLGTVLDPAKINGIFGGTIKRGTSLSYADELRKDTERVLEKVGANKSDYIIESLEVSAPVQVVQKLDKEELKEHAEMIGSLSAQYIQEGFTKRGIKRSTSLF